MTNEGLQQEVKRLEEQIKDLKIKLEEKAEKKPYEVEVPEDIDDYYFTDKYGDSYILNGFSTEFVYSHYLRGLAFKTEEQAEQYDKERVLLFKLHKWAEEHNGGWKPNWENRETKYHITYEMEQEFFNIEYCVCYQQFSKLPYFKTEKIAKQFIKEFGEEIEEALC